MRKVEIAVVGAGPAGLSAAIAAAQAGAEVLVIDENPQLGGQIYRQPPQQFQLVSHKALSPEQREGKRLLEHARSLPIEFLMHTIVWGIFDGKHICLLRGKESIEIWAEKLILAPGVYERPIPFPGWTLPGVMTAGGVQIMLKGQWIIPGQRFLLAGTGPLQLALASQLLTSGAGVAGIADVSSRRQYMKYLPRLRGEWQTLRLGMGYAWNVWKNRVPFVESHAIIRAEGKDRVESAVTADVDENWRPIAGTERVWEVDSICVGYGFIPSLELATLAGCRIHYVENYGIWIPERDQDMRSSVPGVFIVGDGAGVEGATAAAHEGCIAGTNAVMELGYIKKHRSHPALSSYQKLHQLRGFRAALDEIYRFKPGLYDVLEDDTLICRCEEVSFAEVKDAIRAGCENVNQIKSWTRCGMGLCQGRFCEFTIAQLLARLLGKPVEAVGRFTTRPPTRPVPIEVLAYQENS